MEKKLLKVEGMNCGHCVKAVTGALSALPGIADIDVDLKEGSVSFNFDSSCAAWDTTLAAVKAAIANEGYKITG